MSHTCLISTDGLVTFFLISSALLGVALQGWQCPDHPMLPGLVGVSQGLPGHPADLRFMPCLQGVDFFAFFFF